jgi:hypothetical protein
MWENFVDPSLRRVIAGRLVTDSMAETYRTDSIAA